MRPTFDDYFLGIAQAVAVRADCSRRQVGSVVVRDHRIVASGYNGAPPGAPGCLTDGACPRGSSDVPSGSNYDDGPGRCIAVHAEANAILYAGRDGCLGSTLYVTDEPCFWCQKTIRASGLARVVWPGREVDLRLSGWRIQSTDGAH